ncbi:ABC transporter substrate-binding protein [Phreatobacter sp. AB_2022a]|uniref:ABC transporter substrate-binding protein n=1 Tax=Phreatobacter sp. AB_2022a TaxID=3003134 RepID=UPI0022876E2A|nr:ABC transporter substrate-binding protein [Phreatobacter sp. AB_2022a]MCZ0734526.1 ABC transporter substrate-binding protein [Phreatobacter sp. AB_2022a]
MGTRMDAMSRRRLLAGLAGLGGATALGLGRAGAQGQEPLRFGLAMPLSGGQALYGQDQVKAAEWAVAAINAAGGVNGRKLEMILLDTRADPQVGIQSVNRLVSVEKVPVFVSAWSAVVKAVAPIANDSKVVQLSVGANSADIARLGDYTYTTFPLADVDITALANYSATRLGKKRAAVLYINNETGVVAAQIYRDVFTRSGGQVVAYEAYDPKASDWTGSLLKVRVANPDIVHIQGLVADTPQVIAQMRQLGLTMPVSSYSAVYNPKLIEQLGRASEGVIATSLAPGIEVPAVKDYVERWRKEVGREPNGLPYTQYLYDAPYIVAQVFKSLDDKKVAITGESFRQEMVGLRTFDLPLTGRLVMNENHTVSKPVFLMEVTGGAWSQLAIVN